MDSDMDEEESGPDSGNTATAALPKGADFIMNTIQRVEVMEKKLLNTDFPKSIYCSILFRTNSYLQ